MALDTIETSGVGEADPLRGVESLVPVRLTNIAPARTRRGDAMGILIEAINVPAGTCAHPAGAVWPPLST
jgi:hypothetical protein